MMNTKLLMLAMVFGVSGCTSYESARNTHAVREYLTEDIEEQIVFNLIRAYNGLPFAHYDVSTVQSIVSMQASGSDMASRSGVSSRFQPGLVVTSAVRAVTRGFTGGISGQRTNTVTINVAPIFDEPRIYASYVRFLNLPEKRLGENDNGRVHSHEKKQGAATMETVSITTTTTDVKDKNNNADGASTKVETAQESQAPSTSLPQITFGRVHSVVRDESKPPRDACVPRTLRYWDGHWYYVPIQYRPEFSDLCLSLVARGNAGAAPGSGSGAGGKKKDATAKALEGVKSELMLQNSLPR